MEFSTLVNCLRVPITAVIVTDNVIKYTEPVLIGIFCRTLGPINLYKPKKKTFFHIIRLRQEIIKRRSKIM